MTRRAMFGFFALLAILVVMGEMETHARARKPQPCRVGNFEITMDATPSTDTGPTYLNVWAREPDGTNEEGKPKYKVVMTSECQEVSPGVGGCTREAAEAEIARIFERGYYRLGDTVWPVHMIEHIRIHTEPANP